jgi:hypothetical protein
LQLFAFEGFIKINFTNQLSQYIRGTTSISKTQIIKTIKEYFLKTNTCKDKLCIITYSANIVLLRGGTIIHSLLGLSIDKNTIINKYNIIPNS